MSGPLVCVHNLNEVIWCRCDQYIIKRQACTFGHHSKLPIYFNILIINILIIDQKQISRNWTCNIYGGIISNLCTTYPLDHQSTCHEAPPKKKPYLVQTFDLPWSSIWVDLSIFQTEIFALRVQFLSKLWTGLHPHNQGSYVISIPYVFYNLIRRICSRAVHHTIYGYGSAVDGCLTAYGCLHQHYHLRHSKFWPPNRNMESENK